MYLFSQVLAFSFFRGLFLDSFLWLLWVFMLVFLLYKDFLFYLFLTIIVA